MIADSPLPLMWPSEAPVFTAAHFDDLLAWATKIGASDIRLQTDRRITVQIHGRVRRVSRRHLSANEVEEAANVCYGADGIAHIKTGRDFDIAYEPGSRERRRYRVNAKGALARGQDGVALVIRTLPSGPRDLSTQNIEPAIEDAFQPDKGLVIVAGGTGEGKTQLLGSFVHRVLVTPDSNRVILEYSAPVEIPFDDVESETSEITQVEIGNHLPTFADGIRNAMRGAADDIIVGECRDAETMSAAIDAGLTNHRVFTSIHAGGVFETTQRIVSLCPADRREDMTISLAQTLRLVVNRRLVWSADGTRTPIHEFLVCDRATRRRLAQTDPAQWPQLVEALTEERGTTFLHSIRRALAERRITEDMAERLAQEINDVA